MSDEKAIRERAIEAERKLVDQGKLIAGGWAAFCVFVLPDDAPGIQVVEMRKAFFAGAQHLWASIMTILEPDADPTPKDLERMSLISKELDDYVEEIKRKT